MNRSILDSMPSAPQLTPEGVVGMQSASLDQLATAKALADAEIRNIKKASSNPFYGSDYADLDAVTRAVRPVYASHGLSLVQAPWWLDGMDVLVTTLLHASGQWMRSVMRIAALPDKSGVVSPQAYGSAVSYARRYSLLGLTNCCGSDADLDADDDAEAAMGREAPAAPPAEAKKPAEGSRKKSVIVDDIADTLGEMLPGAESRLAADMATLDTHIGFSEWQRDHATEMDSLRANDRAAYDRLAAAAKELKQRKGW